MSANITRPVAETAGFIPTVWAQRALDFLRSNIVLARLVARDTDYEAQPRGKTLTIPFPGSFTVVKKASGTPVDVQAPTGGNSVQVTLSEHATVDFLVEDFARVQANSELIDRYVEPAAVAIAEQLERDLFTLYSSLTGGTVGVSGTDLTPASIRQAAKLLDDAKAPQSNRMLVISPKDRVALLGNAELSNYFANARPEAVAMGSLGNLYGFETFMSQLTPVVAGSPASTKNLATHKNAMILATRPLDEPMAVGVDAENITDPDSGLSIRVLRNYDVANRGYRVGFDLLYGYTALRPTQGVVALS